MEGSVRRIAVELKLVAVPTANLQFPVPSPPESCVTEGDFALGFDAELSPEAQCAAVVKRLYQLGKGLVNLCGNRLRVEVHRGFQDLTFKAANAHGKRVRRAWLRSAFGPTSDENGKPLGLSQSGRTRVTADLGRGLISRREATFLGIQFSLLIASRFEVLALKEWDEFRHFLFRQVYEVPKITTLGKTYKKFTTALGNHLLRNKLLADPSGQLRAISKEWIVANRILHLLARLKIDFFTAMPSDKTMWYVAHLTQSRFLPGPSRSEVIQELVGLKSRLCGPRDDQWQSSKSKRDSVTSATYIVGSELLTAKGFKLPTQGHLSLSNSGCIEFSRKEGGKMALLWNAYKEFIKRPVSDFFPVRLKENDRLNQARELLASVSRSISISAFSHDSWEVRPDPWGESRIASRDQDRYMYGNYEKDQLVQKAVSDQAEEGLTFRVPSPWTIQDLSESRDLRTIGVFMDYPELLDLVDDTVPKIYGLERALTGLKARIKRLEDEFTGTYDLWGNTICKLPHRDLPIWKTAYLDTPLTDEKFLDHDHIEFENGLRVLDTKAGVDSRFGRLLFLWSTIEFEEWNKSRKALPVEAVPISEPGVKSRVATKSLIWVNLFLSPASHFIKDIMLRIPGCRVGLKGSDHAWNFEASWGRHCDKWTNLDAECISTSDLTAATDYLEHDIGIAAMKAFLDGVGLSGPIRNYLDAAIELNASARLLIDKPSSFRKGNGIRNVKIFRKYQDPVGFRKTEFEYLGTSYSGFVTRRGLLMGEPLTKMMLSLLSIAAERSARANSRDPVPTVREFQLSRTKRHIYACAGDDHIGIGRFRYLAMIPKILEFWSGVISWDKYCISTVGAHYCQDFLLLPRPGRRYAIRAQDTMALSSGFGRPKYKIDHVPIRLLSDRRKTGPDVFEEPNPFPGKAKALTETLSWQDASPHWIYSVVLLQKLGLGRWFPSAYLKDYRSYVPQIYGGRGLPTPAGIAELLSPALQHCIANVEEVAVRVANTSGISRKVRGLILDGNSTEVRLKDLSLPSYSYEEAVESINSEPLSTFGSVSYTSTHKTLREDFVPASSLDLVSQKVAVAIKAFRGPAVLKEKQDSYESRMRHVAQAQKVAFSLSPMDMPSTEEIARLLAMRNGPHRQERYVRRTDIEGILPDGWIPSFTIPVNHLSGSSSLIEMEDRVIPQLRPPSVFSALNEEDAISVSGTDQDHSSLGSIGGISYN